jgi:hypothetical protein
MPIDGELEPDALGEQPDLTTEEAHGIHVELGVARDPRDPRAYPEPRAETGDGMANSAASAIIDSKAWRIGAVHTHRMAELHP